MEVITHAAIGALIGELTLGKRSGTGRCLGSDGDYSRVGVPDVSYYGGFVFLLERRGLHSLGLI